MIKGLIHEQVLAAKAKTGMSPGIVVWAVLALVFLVVAVVFALVAAYAWLSRRYDPVTAALVLAGFYLALTIVSLLALVLSRRHNRKNARAELLLARTARQHGLAAWMDPRTLTIAGSIFSTLGYRRLVPIVAAGILAATLGREWVRARKPSQE